MIFIGGYMQSGTTLLLRILAKHSKIAACKYETKFMEQAPYIESFVKDQRKKNEMIFRIIEGEWQQVWEENKNSNIPQKILNLEGNVYQIFSDIMKISMEEGKNEVLEKTPSNIYFLDEILKNFSNAKIILIHRNPLQVLASKKQRISKESFVRYSKEVSKKKKFEKSYNAYLDALSWRKAANHTIQYANCTQVFTISYDDLVNNSKDTVTHICKWLGIGFESNMMSIDRANSADLAKTKKRGIFKDSLYAYKNILSTREIGFISQFCKKEMKILKHSSEHQGHRVYVFFYFVGGVFSFVIRGYKRFRFMSFNNFLIVAKNYLRRG